MLEELARKLQHFLLLFFVIAVSVAINAQRLNHGLPRLEGILEAIKSYPLLGAGMTTETPAEGGC